MGASAQDHLKFMNIPISGSLDDFAKKLEAKGFEPYQVEDDFISLTGPYAGYNNCFVYIYTRYSIVYNIEVYFAYVDDVHSAYNDLRRRLGLKYGAPSHVDDNTNGDGSYRTSFYLPAGEIRLTIEDNNLDLNYYDTNSYNAAIGVATSDL